MGKEAKGSALERGDRSEAALVERDEPPGPVPVSEHDERGVGQAKLELAVPAGHVASEPELVAAQAFRREGADGEIVEKRQFHVDTEACEDQIVSFGRGDLRRHERAPLGPEKLDDGPVIGIVAIRLGVHSTGVDDQRHESAGAAFPQPPLRELVR